MCDFCALSLTLRQTNTYARTPNVGAAAAGLLPACRNDFGIAFAQFGAGSHRRVSMRRARFLTSDSRPRALESEELLLLAVLEQAVADLDHPCPAVRADAMAYVYSYESDYSIFSFDSVCAYFKLSPNAVREALRMRQGRRTRVRPAEYQTAA
jgi:hypothetical protein